MPEWSEILVILVVAMVVFGPHRLPTMARKAGKMMAEFRMAARELREGIERELAVEEMKEVAKEVLETTKEASQEARKSLAESDRALRAAPPLARPTDTAPGTAREDRSSEPDSGDREPGQAPPDQSAPESDPDPPVTDQPPAEASPPTPTPDQPS